MQDGDEQTTGVTSEEQGIEAENDAVQPAEQSTEATTTASAPASEAVAEPELVAEPVQIAETPSVPEPDVIPEVGPTIPVPTATPPTVSDVPVAQVPETVLADPVSPAPATPVADTVAEPAVVTPPTPQPTPPKEQGGIPQKVLDLTPDELDAARRLWASRTIRGTQKASVQARKNRVAENMQRVEHFVKKYGPTTVRTVGLELGMSTRRASDYLISLSKAGKIKATGNTTTRRYS